MKFTAEQQAYLERVIELEGLEIIKVKDTIYGNVKGSVWGNVQNVLGHVRGSISGNVLGDVWGNVQGVVIGKEIT